MSVLPPIWRKHRICVICEGYEDYHYFNRLIALNLWDASYSFTTINAKSASNIPARFQNEYQNDRYEIILVFCDTDKEPYREYTLVKNKINSFLGKRKASEKLVIFANPCTMQIVLLHFGDISLRNQGKKTNSAEIERLTGVPGYDAHEEQIQALCGKITRANYPDSTQTTSLIGGLRNFVGEIFQPVLIKKPTRAITVLSRNRSAMLVSAELGMSALLALSVGRVRRVPTLWRLPASWISPLPEQQKD
ncbi:MAG TPA: hypothetical protein IAB20_10305 [Candidatus Pullichristensenella excrementipullorum]|nr:hypothetical protein [Candidatus Pullichristensenella excrementipullorum]